jgi:DNA-3-methyladenine glycosylase
VTPQRLTREFFARPAPEVARDMLGTVLVRCLQEGQTLRARVVETEAYHGADDTGSHARAGETNRTALMFGEAGFAYIYLIYGMYQMLNVTTSEVGYPSAVLVRAVEPLEGLETMAALRPGPHRNLTNGPGKLCQAMAIDRSLNGEDLIHSHSLWFEAGSQVPGELVGRSPRIGIDYAGEEHRVRPWRFFQKGNLWLSR